MLWRIKYELSKLKERALIWVAWRLPKKLVVWAFSRVVAHATTGEYSRTLVPALTAADALARWLPEKNLDDVKPEEG